MNLFFTIPMRKTLSRFTSSFAALLSERNSIVDISGRLEGIREAMLDALMELDGDHGSGVWSKIGGAPEVQTLWYLRSEVMALLAAHAGEQMARQKLDAITELFRGVVPDNQMPLTRRFNR
jgi:hypothetical protein